MGKGVASIQEVREFFGYRSGRQFSKEWRKLTDTQKVSIREEVAEHIAEKLLTV